MKHASVGAAAVAVALLAGCSSAPASSLDARGTIAPAADRTAAPGLSAKDLDGATIDLAAMKGKVVVLNLFGSWCPPCRDETPALARTYVATKARGVEFVGVATRDTVGKLRPFLSMTGVTYPVVDDGDGSLEAPFAQIFPPAPPGTLVIDRQGRVAARFFGAVLGTELQQTVDRVAAEPA